MSTPAVSVNAVLSNIVVSAMQDPSEFIADRVSQRIPVPAQVVEYTEFDEENWFADFGNDIIPPGGRATRINTKLNHKLAKAQWYGYEAAVDKAQNRAQMEAARGGATVDLQAAVMIQLYNQAARKREERVADIVKDATNYATALRATLSGDDLEDNNTDNATVTAINEAISKCTVRPDIFVTGEAQWQKISHSPDLIAAVLGRDSLKGVVTPKQFAKLFGVEEVLIGGAFKGSKSGAKSSSRIWGSYAANEFLCAFLKRGKSLAELSTISHPSAFMACAEYASTQVVEYVDNSIGPEGGIVQRPVSCHVDLHLSNVSGVQFTLSALAS